MNEEKWANLAELLKRATDILFVMNPKGTSMGVFLGVIIRAVIEAVDPLLKRQPLMDLSRINIFYCICFGIFIFNLRPALRAGKLDPQIESALRAIKKAKKEGHISAAHARLRYINLIDKVIEQIDVDKETKERMLQIQKISTRGGPLGS